LRENIWNTSHPVSFARSTARSSEPAIETWTPTRTINTPFCMQWDFKADLFRRLQDFFLKRTNRDRDEKEQNTG
jgi:hypothetical protein